MFVDLSSSIPTIRTLPSHVMSMLLIIFADYFFGIDVFTDVPIFYHVTIPFILYKYITKTYVNV